MNIQQIPQEVLLHIFSFLQPNDLGNASMVCRIWKKVAEDSALWKVFGVENKSQFVANHLLFKKIKEINPSVTKKDLGNTVFSHIYKLDENTCVLVGPGAPIKFDVETENWQAVEETKNMDNTRFVSGGKLLSSSGNVTNNTVKLFALTNFSEPIGSFVANWDDRLYDAAYFNERLYIANADSGIRFVHLKTRESYKIHEECKEPILLAFYNGCLFYSSAVEPKNIYKTDIETEISETILKLESHVNSFQVEGDKIVAGCIDGTVVLWDFKTEKKIFTCKNSCSVTATLFFGEYIAFGDKMGTVVILDKSGTVIRAFQGESFIEEVGSYSGLGGKELWSVYKKVDCLAFAKEKLISCQGHYLTFYDFSKPKIEKPGVIDRISNLISSFYDRKA